MRGRVPFWLVTAGDYPGGLTHFTLYVNISSYFRPLGTCGLC